MKNIKIMEQNKTAVSKEIDKIKAQLNAILEHEKLDAEEVLRLSVELDKLINQWYKAKDA